MGAGMVFKTKLGFTLLVWMAACSVVGTANGQGVTITGVGPVNRSMGGAGTAAPLEAIGALHWNPGSISALPDSELSFGLELIHVNAELSSTIGGLTDSTSGEAGFSPVPSIGWVHHLEDTPWTIGLGVYGIAGFKNNLPADPTNLLLAAGPAYADAEVLQLAPTISYACTDRLSIGVAPTVTLGTFTLNPLGPSVLTPTPTPGSGNRVHWGGGFQLGAYYIASECLRFGFTFKSPQWFEEFRFFAPQGVLTLDLDYPMILSLGAAFSGGEKVTIATDFRYFDWQNTDGFREFGWSNVFAFAIGAQYRATERIYLRAGYNVNGNPIKNDDVFTNVITPLIQDQNVAVGGSLRISRCVDLNAAYVYLVDNSVTGPLPPSVFGPGSTLENTISAHSALFGLTVRY
jgi:long-chain fatty acid transport protein